MSDREQIEELYHTYWRCMINKDIAGMDRLMADDYELRHMTGLRQPKQDFFRSLASGELNYYFAKHDEGCHGAGCKRHFPAIQQFCRHIGRSSFDCN